MEYQRTFPHSSEILPPQHIPRERRNNLRNPRQRGQAVALESQPDPGVDAYRPHPLSLQLLGGYLLARGERLGQSAYRVIFRPTRGAEGRRAAGCDHEEELVEGLRSSLLAPPPCSALSCWPPNACSRG